MPEKKNGGFARFVKNLFLRNWDLKLGALALGFLFWILFVMAI